MQISYNQFNTLLDGSMAFRQLVFAQVSKGTYNPADLRKLVTGLCATNYDSKVRAILSVQRLSEFFGHQTLIDAFSLNTVQASTDVKLGLANSKQLVEMCYDFNNKQPK